MIARYIILTVLVAACESPETSVPVPTPPASAPVSNAQFQTLRWLEGSWRGVGDGVEPFFERYQFVDDSTLRRYTFSDSTFARISDSGMTSLRGGRVVGGEGEPRWQATSFDSVSWHFESLREANSAFTWRRDTPDSWTATLAWRDPRGNARERVYTLRRVTP